MQQDSASEAEPGNSEGSDASIDSHPEIHPPSSVGNRQEAILFHLQDAPIRTFLEWTEYDQMIAEIAFHYSINPASVVDAYEVNTPLPGLPPDAIPIIAHLFPDIAVGQQAKLVLFDLEVHGHRSESHFQVGPVTRRFVLPVPEWVDRKSLLLLANVDIYCQVEGGRCLLWLDGFRWPDYDIRQRRVAHGDYIRITIPPSLRHDCPTSQMLHWTQAGLSDMEILDLVVHDEVQVGYSPSLLDPNEVRALARSSSETEEDDVFHAMQSCSPAHSTHSTSSDWSRAPLDWHIDLQRVVEAETRQVCAHEPFELMIYTWLLDDDRMSLCTQPKIAWISGDPTAWEEEILFPWRYHTIHHETYALTCVQPTPPKSDLERHIAHILIVKQSTPLESILISLEFQSIAAATILVRFALLTPKRLTIAILMDKIPLLRQLDYNRIGWTKAGWRHDDDFKLVHSGMCIRIPVVDAEDVEGPPIEIDFDSLVQTSSRQKRMQNLQPMRAELGSCHPQPGDSLTEEFLQAIEAARNAAEPEQPPIDPDSIDAQPEVFRIIWDRVLQTSDTASALPQRAGRIESWYLHHAEFTRCHTSRITLIGEDFRQWQQQIAATWNDRVRNRNELSFSLVHPEPEDAATGTLAQIIITERENPEFKSCVVSVYDSDPDAERRPYTLAVVLPRRINLSRLLGLLHMQTDCPPHVLENLCSLWFGRIPIGANHEVNVLTGNAFRLIISRGIRMEIPHLLTMENTQLRAILQRAVRVEIYDRPSEPNFTQVVAETSSAIEGNASTLLPADARPPWIPVLEQHFRRCHQREPPDYLPTLQVLVWFLNDDTDYHCTLARDAMISDESFMWRTELIFRWRDRIIRASPIDVVALPSLIASTSNDTPMPHVILTQGLQSNSFAVLITVRGTGPLQRLARQFAHVFYGRILCREVIRLAVPEEHRHRPVIVQMAGQTYFPDDVLFVQMGTHLSVLISADNVDIYTDQIADAFNLMQQPAHMLCNAVAIPRLECKPADFELPDDFSVSLPGSNHPRSRPERPLQDDDMQWSLDLGALFQTHGILNAWNDELTLSVATWFVHHNRHPACHQPRHLRLLGNPITWAYDLRHAWMDLLERRLPFSIHVVKPRPPQYREHGHVCHIILEQAPSDDRTVAILTALVEGTMTDGIIQGAFSVGYRVNLDSVIRSMEVSFLCHAHHCTLVQHRRPVQIGTWIDIHPGESIYVRITPVQSSNSTGMISELTQHFDDLTLMQPVDSTPVVSGLNPLAPEFTPDRPAINTQPERLQDLFAIWSDCSYAWEEETRAMHVLTWFVAPGIGMPRCLQSRKATLYGDFAQWENILKARWEGLLDQHTSINFVVVSPGPPHLEPTISAHVLLIQHPMPEWSTPLITIYDPAVNQGQPFRLVATLPDITADRNILVATSYDRDCQAQGTQCFFRLERHTIPPGHRVRISDGHNIIMQVCRANLPANWCPPIQPEEPGTEGLGLLQLPAARSATSDTIKLDMAPAIRAFEWIDSHLFLPTFSVPDVVQLYTPCRSWLALPFWAIGIRCDTLTIYLGGSFCSTTQQAGVAVAAFICSDNTWYQAGMISSRICADNSYQAEVSAALVASKFAFDLIKQICFGQIQPCSLWLGFDSLTVGQQMLGKWNSHKSPLTTSILRSLHRIISARFGIEPQAWHIHSHQGELGNELVDSLALHAAQHEGTHDVTHFLQFLTQKSIVQALEWAWMLFEPHYHHMWSGTDICLPDAPLTVPKEDVFPLVPNDTAIDDEGVGRIALCFGTCNVLTLKGVDEPQWGLQGVARQDSILEQFHMQGIQIVALQETRLKKLFRAKDDRYVLVKSAATASGCYGIILALSKKHPHGHIPSKTGDGYPVYFTEQHVSIIAAESRILIVRVATPILRCIIIAAHAPHSGYSDL